MMVELFAHLAHWKCDVDNHIIVNYLLDHRKRDVDMVAQDVRDNTRLHTAALHGDMTQARRDSMLNAIKTGRAQVLVATDVAARGLDVKTVKQV